MEKADLIKKIAEILGVNKPKDDLAFEIFLEKISERLNFNEAIRIPGVGIFQLREEPFTGVKKTFAGVDAGNKTELMFAPFVKDSDSLYLTFDIKKIKKKSNDFSDDIFSIGVEKPIIPISSNQNELLDADTSYILVRKSLGELIDKLFDKSDHLENFDLWDDFINSKRSSEYEILEEVVLDEQFQEIDNVVSDISDDENNELINIEVEEETQKLSEQDGDIFELDDFDVKEESTDFSDQVDEEEVTESFDIPEESSVEGKTNELFDEIIEDEAQSAEETPTEGKVIPEDDLIKDEELLGDELLDFDSLDEEEDLELNDAEIDEIQDILKDEELTQQEDIPEKPQEEELKDDDFDLSEDELNALLENEDDIDDDWDWGDELKQEIVDQDEVEADQESLEDMLDDNSDDLFDQLDQSLQDETPDDFDDEEVDESLLNLEEQLKDEDEVEEKSTPENETAENLEETEENDKLDSLLQKKDKKLSFMAKIKQKLGMFFWILVGVFVLTTAGGIYYFLFVPQEINLDDPLLDEYNTMVMDSTQQDSTKLTLIPDSVEKTSMDSIQKALDQAADKVVKDEPAKTELKTKPLIDEKKTDTQSEQKKNIREQKPVEKDKTIDHKIKTGSIKFVENPKESKIGNSHIYKSNNKYSVQVSSWRKKEQAEKVAKKLIEDGLDVFIVKVYLRKLSSTWYRVRVGEFSTLEEARNFEKKNK